MREKEAKLRRKQHPDHEIQRLEDLPDDWKNDFLDRESCRREKAKMETSSVPASQTPRGFRKPNGPEVGLKIR